MLGKEKLTSDSVRRVFKKAALTYVCPPVYDQRGRFMAYSRSNSSSITRVAQHALPHKALHHAEHARGVYQVADEGAAVAVVAPGMTGPRFGAATLAA